MFNNAAQGPVTRDERPECSPQKALQKGLKKYLYSAHTLNSSDDGDVLFCLLS
jgi:hypothetical protein